MADSSILNKIFAQKGQQGERKHAGARFAPGWPMLAALCLILICAVAWAFYMGYMVGRGQNPEAGLHEITGLGNAPPASAGEVKTEESASEPAPIPAALTRPQGEAATSAWAEAQKPEQAPRPNPQRRPQPRQAAQNTVQYAYTFQLAAIREQAEAQKLQKSLQAKGIKASVRKSGKVFLVTTELRGGATEVSRLKERLKSLKLGEPLQVARKPLENKRR